MSLKNFLLSKIFFKHLGLAVTILIGLTLAFMIWLNIYTRHGQSRPVPDLAGLTIEEASKAVRKSKLKYHIVDSLYTTAVGRGCVAEQNPKPGFKVKKWRRIMITVNALNPEMVAMPDLVGLPLRQADKVIQSSGLKTGLRSYIPDLSVDYVLKQLHNKKNVAPGDSIQKGSVIDLVLGKGLSNERTPVPELTGMQLEKAKNYILSASLNLGAYIFDNSVADADDSVNAFVYRQNPEYKESARLQLGSAVYIWLTIDSTKLPVDSTMIVKADSLTPPGLK